MWTLGLKGLRENAKNLILQILKNSETVKVLSEGFYLTQKLEPTCTVL